MSYVALYRRWRPKTFTEVVGQKQVSETLMRAIREDKVAHAYLFSGPRGTGKTSMAKIFARAINCEHGPTDHPCNTCRACTQILNGDSMDVLEIDAASNRGIDEIRSLRESIQFMPVDGRKKIFIIDEAHMLTTEAWNALLKTIEEPPAHVMFIFATTEQEKLPVTILSRCQRYTFKRITAEEIAKHLLYVASKSEIDLDTGAAYLLAVHADGGLRDALSMLDQCSGMAEGIITADMVEDMIGLVSKRWVIALLDKLESGDGAGVLGDIQEALAEGRDARQVLEALMQHLRALLIARVLPQAEELSVYESFKSDFVRQYETFSMARLNSYIRRLQQLQNDAKRVDNPRLIIEMGLLGICAALQDGEADLAERVALLEEEQSKEAQSMLDRLTRLEQNGVPVGIGNGNVVATEVSERAETAVSYDFLPVQVPVRNGLLSVEDTSTHDEISASANKVNTHKPLPPPKVSSATKGNRGVQGSLPSNPGSRKILGATGAVTSSMMGTNDPNYIDLGQQVMNPRNYREIHKKMVQWLEKNGQNMCASMFKLGQLVYIDEKRVVIVFNNALNVTIIGSNTELYGDATKAFQSVLQSPVILQAIVLNSAPDKAYREAAKQALEGVRTETTPEVESFSPDMVAPPPEEEHLSEGEALAEPQLPTPSAQQTPIPVVKTETFQVPPRSGGTEVEAFLPSVPDEGVPLPPNAVKWDISQLSEEEKQNPLLVSTLTHLSEEHDIYIEYVDDEEDK